MSARGSFSLIRSNWRVVAFFLEVADAGADRLVENLGAGVPGQPRW